LSARPLSIILRPNPMTLALTFMSQPQALAADCK
jgi:hypothetical protein